nr:unnamed protein product [Spirometra erinaceieuropaei]
MSCSTLSSAAPVPTSTRADSVMPLEPASWFAGVDKLNGTLANRKTSHVGETNLAPSAPLYSLGVTPTRRVPPTGAAGYCGNPGTTITKPDWAAKYLKS